MSDAELLAARFEEHRARLRAVALRMLGSRGEADDAVQEAWLRLRRTDADGVDNLGGWLTTVVARVSLDMLRSRAARREDSLDEPTLGHPVELRAETDPEEESLLAGSVGAALLVVLETLAPAERLAFVLHDTFAVPFVQIGEILHRSPTAAKQLAHRARRKVQGSNPSHDLDPARQREIVDAFLAASRHGEFDALVALLDPGVVLEADVIAVRMGADEIARGASDVAGTFSGRAQGAQPALIDGAVGIAWAVNGRTKVAWDVTITDGKITRIEMIADPESLSQLDLTLL